MNSQPTPASLRASLARRVWDWKAGKVRSDGSVYITMKHRHNGKSACVRVDATLLPRLEDHCLSPVWDPHSPGERPAIWIRKRISNNCAVQLHRWIMGLPSRNIDKREVDHKNGQANDDRASNLRTCTRSQNEHHRVRLPSNNTSGHIGVSWSCTKQRWIAHLKVLGKHVLFKACATMPEAIRARKRAEKEHLGEFRPWIRRKR